ncbi:MAG: DUF3592 domain-containing protein [Bacilli bacterium]|nr:DUF3592 domain-containing protein [Bacilli bacterium]
MGKWINWILGILFLVIGIGCVVGFVFTKNSNDDFMKKAVETSAEIVRIKEKYDSLDEDYEYTVYVEFDVDGLTYEGILNEYHSGMREGDKVTIYYDPQDPENFRSGSDFLVFIPLIVGVIFAIVGSFLLIFAIKKSKKIKNLKSTGKIITAEINEVIINRNTTVNGRHPYQVICSANIDGVMYTFTSDDIWFDISMVVTGLGIKQVQVYINPMKPSEYHVDVENLKQYISN